MILILDSNPLDRQGLISVIQSCKPGESVMEAENISDAMQIIKRSNINIAFIDICLESQNGFDFIVWLKHEYSMIKTFLITSSSLKNDFIYAKKLGVDAYVLKNSFIDEIVFGLKVIDRGGKFYSASLMDNINFPDDSERILYTLTKREREVLPLIQKGYSNLQISRSLYITTGTVKKHISNILGKLGLKNRIEIILFADKIFGGK